MKKLAVFFIVLISLMVIVGCNQSQKTVTRFSPDDDTNSDNGSKTTITKIDNGANTKPAQIEIPSSGKTLPNAEFAVTYPASDSITSDKGYHLIQGTTPNNTDKVLVNGKALTKYKPGNTKWNYIAAASLGNLTKGINNYTVTSMDKNGVELGSKSFTIDYKGIEAPVLASKTLAQTGFDSILISLLIAIFGFFGISKFVPAFIKTKK